MGVQVPDLRRRGRVDATPTRRFRRRLGALLAAAVTAFSLAAPGALAGPTPPPSHDSSSTTVIWPGLDPASKKTTPAQLDEAYKEAGRRLAADPRGRALIRAWRDWAKGLRLPSNISVQWFDFSWMESDPQLPVWLRNNVDDFYRILTEAVSRYPGFKDPEGYRVTTQSVAVDTEANLYDSLGVPKNGLLFQVATGNEKWAGHSEENGLEWTTRAVNTSLRTLAEKTIGRKQMGFNSFKKETNRILARAPRGLAGQRTPCAGRCDIQTKAFSRNLAIADYTKAGTASSRIAQTVVPRVMQEGEAELSRQENGVKEKAKKAEEMATQDLGQCHSSGGLRRPGEDFGGNGVRMAVWAAPPADDCSRTALSPLAEALSSQNLGGVDFSTLGIRYMSDNPGSGGVRYSLSGRPAAPGSSQDADSGLDALTNSTADLRTWLALDPSKFWVNLNPTEPNRIVDPQLGRTNAGKALLEADLRMKQTEGKLIDPKTPLGARYWKAMGGPTDTICYSSRLWIVPGDVEVRQDGSSLYIVKATLQVKAKAQHPGGGYGCDSDPASDARGERLEQTMLVPKVEEAVNTAPEYAPIRRAFLARVVAQWIRDRHQSGHHTSFDGLIDSGDLGSAVLTDGWQPRQVFDSYVRALRDKDFTYHQTMRVGDTRVIRTITYGGVDFSKLSSARLSAAQMNQRLPRLSQTVKASGTHPAKASDGSIWLGESAGSGNSGLWSRVSGTVGAFVTGRTGILVLIVAALGLVTFGIRGSGRKRRA
ncbi:hypothetical protein [Actinoallomurus iriomotensis]|uniref:Uncharacterized protein n=1 Tax=Actinoallomurus iriomotensis TaxID=478107 RepID=A0A9W6RSD0_9ACTN|nr:hypothetical protein [Actinoallomurus iriomotensis]GLY79302.1 hypothetical protein Airi01_075690 [Actinoallomurus iriomotensis]